MTLVSSLHEKWMEDPTYRIEFEALEAEFQLAHAISEARAKADLTQDESDDRE
jgi:hypothetical protein